MSDAGAVPKKIVRRLSDDGGIFCVILYSSCKYSPLDFCRQLGGILPLRQLKKKKLVLPSGAGF